jgi:phosphatidylserine decarboxylase
MFSLAQREALKIVLPIVMAAFIAWLCFPALWAKIAFGLLLALAAFALFFFRDPKRVIPADPRDIVAGADGRVVGIEEIAETPLGIGRTKRVAIFLSVMDVHINRMPVEGTVEVTKYQKGLFLDVRHPECSIRNENLAWHIRTPRGPVVVRQIAGLIARRIVAWAKVGDALSKGQRFGMIRFGSRTEIYLPLECEITVQLGDYVYGGSSVIARWP